MAKAVDLLSYYMPVLRNLKEFKEIAKAEEPEIQALLEAVDRTLANMFISTADEYGITQFEEMMGILPENTADLETRRFNVLVKWNDNTIYTDVTLEGLLTTLCGGKDRYKIDRDYEHYHIDVTTTVSVSGAYEMVRKLLSEILPCNLTWVLSNKVECKVGNPLYVGIVTNTVMCHQIVENT
jgi:hypothetical protein